MDPLPDAQENRRSDGWVLEPHKIWRAADAAITGSCRVVSLAGLIVAEVESCARENPLCSPALSLASRHLTAIEQFFVGGSLARHERQHLALVVH